MKGLAKKNKIVILAIYFSAAFLFISSHAYAQEKQEQPPQAPQPSQQEPAPQPAQPQPEVSEQNGRLTLDFKDADMQTVLKVLGEKGNVNVLAGEDVTGTVTIKLTDVPWQKAVDVILKAYGLGYERDGNIMYVSPIEKLAEARKAQKDLAESQPLITEVFVLKYLDANDAKKVVDPQLSSQGKSAVLATQTKKGWKFGATSAGGTTGVNAGKLERVEGAEARSKTLLVSDLPSYMDKIRVILQKVDLMPRQIIIETKIVEVDKNKLDDLGIDWGTGQTGAETTDVQPQQLSKRAAVGSHGLTGQTTPSVFTPKSTNFSPTNNGFKFLYQKLTGDQFEIILHALSEDVDANTLSNPRILTLDNQEATILVGTKYPILETNVSGTDSTTQTTTLKYYQDIGIQLNVVPQISGDKLINMIVHPAVTSYTDTLKAKSSSGQVLAEYPIILTREAETQILMKDGETVVIGGLLKDAKSKSGYNVPILGKIPILGALFRRDTANLEKIDLIIFITAKIVEPPN